MFNYIKEKVKGSNVVRVNTSILCDENLIGKGCNGKVYRINMVDCVKIWNDLFISKEKINKIYKFSNLNVSCAAFPKKISFVKGEAKGYTMEYIDGRYARDCLDFDYSYFVEKINLLIDSYFSELGGKHIMIRDTHYRNVMWDKNKELFRFVDVDSWLLLEDENAKDIDNYNFKQIIHLCADYILGSNDTIYFDKAYDIDMNTDFVDMYETIRKKLENESGRKLNTISDVRQYIKGIK